MPPIGVHENQVLKPPKKQRFGDNPPSYEDHKKSHAFTSSFLSFPRLKKPLRGSLNRRVVSRMGAVREFKHPHRESAQ
jgi:hypothetical protein